MDYQILPPTEPISKTQTIRLLDVFVIGPAMIYASAEDDLPELLRAILFLSSS